MTRNPTLKTDGEPAPPPEKSWRPSTPKVGFTLLELMLSIAILAMLALMLARVFSESSRAIERGRNQTLLDETARMLLDIIEQDVSQALVRTNVAFRVHDATDGDALYFVSPGVRRQSEAILRDMAPMRIGSMPCESSACGLVPILHRCVVMESAIASADTSKEQNMERLRRLSDIYFTAARPTARDFTPIHDPSSEIDTGKSVYTHRLIGTSATTSHAMLSFLDFFINGDQNSNRTGSRPVDPDDLPRFVDVSLGLISSKEMEHAMRLYNAQGPDAANRHIENNELIYTRRIFLPNQGFAQQVL